MRNHRSYVFSQIRAIPIPITTIGMRLPPDRTDGKRVAASKPQALGMDANDRLRLKTYSTMMNSSILIFLTCLFFLFVMLTTDSVIAGESGSEFAIWPTTDDQELPDIDGDIVVWQQFVEEYGDYDIYVADLSTMLKAGMNNPDDPLALIIGDANDQMRPAVFEKIVVWQDYIIQEGSGDWDIMASDLSTLLKAGDSERERPIMFAVSNIFGNDEQFPAIHGNIVVWQDNRNGDWDIFGYNLTTRREFQITNESHDQTNPAISGNMVVWEDNREGNLQIFAIVLDGPEAARCTSKLTGDVNGDCKVDFIDFTLMASQWLECNLEPKEACLPSIASSGVGIHASPG